jgi:hypothetical protein
MIAIGVARTQPVRLKRMAATIEFAESRGKSLAPLEREC